MNYIHQHNWYTSMIQYLIGHAIWGKNTFIFKRPDSKKRCNSCTLNPAISDSSHVFIVFFHASAPKLHNGCTTVAQAPELRGQRRLRPRSWCPWPGPESPRPFPKSHGALGKSMWGRKTTVIHMVIHMVINMVINMVFCSDESLLIWWLIWWLMVIHGDWCG